ncbi:MAG: SIR2 family protein [Deltaproteobacteria bacterium]|nr:SIR2 family protein [Deltaproteobacteria bacterium]
MRITSAHQFADIINSYSYTKHFTEEPAPHISVTFFLGAGFSKAWDDSYPLADKLFNFPSGDVRSSFYDITGLLFENNINSDITPDMLKEIVYHLSMELKYSAIRSRYRDENSIRIALDRIRSSIVKNFLESVTPDYVYPNSLMIKLPKDYGGDKGKILRFFRDVAYHEDGSRGYPTGVRINFITTNYDYIVETILDNISGSTNEPNFLYTYRGITPVNICGVDNPSLIHDHYHVCTLIKINGGFEILANNDGSFSLEYRKRDLSEIYRQPPVIMLPSREQDYGHNYFNSIFPKAVRLLQESKVLVIIGYSFPEDDAMLQFLLRQFAEDYRDAKDKYIFYVDKLNNREQLSRITKCFPHIRKANKRNVHLYSGDFVDWAESATEELSQNTA